jgi:hypothetical protein
VLEILSGNYFWKEVKLKTIDALIDGLDLLDSEPDSVEFYDLFSTRRLVNNGTSNKKVKFGFHKFDKMSLEEFMDLEFYLSYDEDSPYEHLDKFCSIMFRRIVNQKNKRIENILYNIQHGIFGIIYPLKYDYYEIEDYNPEETAKETEFIKSKFTYSMGLAAYNYFEIYKNDLRNLFPELYDEDEEEYTDDKDEVILKRIRILHSKKIGVCITP